MPTTFGQMYEDAVRDLVKSGYSPDEARITARLALDFVTGINFTHLTKPHLLLDVDTWVQVLEALGELKEGRPWAYIRQEREFGSLKFVCDERALVPRPETETLVDVAVERLKDKESPFVADLGTGTGCIAISVAHALPQAMVYATDLSTEAIELAALNASHNNVAARVEFVAGHTENWALPLVREGLSGMLDAVLSNPPYIATEDIKTLQPQIRDWEPRLALDGGADGLDCYRKLAAQCGALLQSNGFIAVELGAGQFDAAQEVFEGAGWHVEPAIYDLAGIARVLVAHPGTL